MYLKAKFENLLNFAIRFLQWSSSAPGPISSASLRIYKKNL